MKRKRGRPPAKNAADFVHTWDDLAHRLGVSRRCLQKWREKFKDAPDLPRPRGDRHNVTAWKKFAAENDLGKEQTEQTENGEVSRAHWDRLRAQVDYERAVYNLELEKQKHLEIADITAAVGRMLAGLRTALNTMPSSAARWLIGVRDFNTIKNKLQEEVDAVLQALGRCDYLNELTVLVVNEKFPDRDEQFRGEMVRCVDAVYRELGRLALSDLLQRALPAAEPAPSPQSESSGSDTGIRNAPTLRQAESNTSAESCTSNKPPESKAASRKSRRKS